MGADEHTSKPLCTVCRHRGGPCAPSLSLLKHLQQALRAAAPFTSPDFETTGAATLDCEGAACPLVFLLSKRGIYIFGDVEEAEAVDDLVVFADRFLGSDGRAHMERCAGPMPAAMTIQQLEARRPAAQRGGAPGRRPASPTGEL